MVFSAHMQPGKLIIFCAPSGAGKTTITRAMMDLFPQLSFSISATTRAPRGKEQQDIDYHFVSVEEFKKMAEAGAFVEWEEVWPGVYYATRKSELERLGNEGKVAVFDIDVKGAFNLKKMFGDHALMIFVKAPLEIIKERLSARQTETPEAIQVRINRVAEEMTYENKADVVIENIDLQKAIADTRIVVENFLNS
jgi:guanylate kinase